METIIRASLDIILIGIIIYVAIIGIRVGINDIKTNKQNKNKNKNEDK